MPCTGRDRNLGYRLTSVDLWRCVEPPGERNAPRSRADHLFVPRTSSCVVGVRRPGGVRFRAGENGHPYEHHEHT